MIPSKQRFVEGVYIEKAWMGLEDFPEPPDEPRVPTNESWNQWDAYREALKKFSDIQKKNDKNNDDRRNF